MAGTQALTDTGAGYENDAFEDNLRAWTTSLARHKSPRTIDSYIRYVRKLAEALGKDPAEWTIEDCEAFLDSPQWAVEWKSNQTKASARSAVKRYWKKVGRSDLVEDPRNQEFWETPRKVWDEDARRKMMQGVPSWGEVEDVLDEVMRVIRESDDPTEIYRHFPLWLVANYGVRCIGAANMRMCDIDPEAREVTIYKSKGKKTRVIAMEPGDPTPELFERFKSARSSILGRLKKAAEGDAVLLAKFQVLADRADSPLFFNREGPRAGEKLDPKPLGQLVSAIADRHLGHHVRPHGFRHAKATHLVKDLKMDLAIVKDYLGHEDVNMTMKYVHTNTKDQAAFFKKAAALDTKETVERPSPKASPSNGNGVSEKVKALGDLKAAGVLSFDEFVAAVKALEGA